MALIVLTSASGAPGVTTSALALALLWPRPVLLVEADVCGGSPVLAGYLRGTVSPANRSLLGLVIGHRQERLEAALTEHTVPLDDAGRVQLVPGIADPVQAASLAPVWASLATAFASLEREGPDGADGAGGIGGVDVIVDAGRLGAAHGPGPLFHQADVVLLVSRTQLPAVASARARAAHLQADLGASGINGDALGLLLVGDGRPYTGPEIHQATGLPVTAYLAWDPGAAEVLSLGAARPRRWEHSAFVRSARSALDAVAARVQERRAQRHVPAHGRSVPGPRAFSARGTSHGTVHDSGAETASGGEHA